MIRLEPNRRTQNARRNLVRRRIPAILLAIAVTSYSGCGQSALPPPVKVTHRQSLVGIGMVVQITNTSGHHLYNVKVVGRSLREVESASLIATEHLRPRDSIEVGWMEFDGWVPQPGETIEVYCDDYALPKVSIVPKPEQLNGR